MSDRIRAQNHAAIMHELNTPWRGHDADGSCCRKATCIHEWTERHQGPGLGWLECWLCGEMTEYR